jgi:hypothetical protein
MDRYSRVEQIICDLEALSGTISPDFQTLQSAPCFTSDTVDSGISTQWSSALVPRRDPQASNEAARQKQLVDEACDAIERGIGSMHVSDLICMLDQLNDLSPGNPRLRLIAARLKRQLDWFTLLMSQGDVALDEGCPEAALTFYRQANEKSPNPLTGAAIDITQRLLESNERIHALQRQLTQLPQFGCPFR